MGFGQSWRVFVRAIRTSYEHLAKVLLGNATWFIVSLSPFLLFIYFPTENYLIFLLSIILSIITFSGSTGALQYIFHKTLKGEEVSARCFWDGFKKHVFKGSIIVFVIILGFSVLAFNILFSRANPSTFFLVLSGFWFWGILYLFVLTQLIFPILVQENVGIREAFKRAALLTLDNPLASAMLLIMSLSVIVLSMVAVGVPFLVFSASFLSILQNYFYTELKVKYLIAAEVEQGEDKRE
ncbi:MAG TPA: DUF624 domain-containing protein [Natronincola sp.]|nr:DUF624 domain-containing protein [Natronincola sp.]